MGTEKQSISQAGLTTGRVTSRLPEPWPVEYEVDVTGGRKIIYFENLFEIENQTTPFALPGDSGSLIVTDDPGGQKIAVGIVVATDNHMLTLALSLDRILDYFGVTLVAGHNT